MINRIVSIKVLTTLGVFLLLLFTVIPFAESHYYFRMNDNQNEHYFQESIWLFLYSDNNNIDFTDSPSLIFGPNHRYINWYDNYRNNFGQYYQGPYNWAGHISIRSNENLTLSITGISDRIYNPDIDLIMDMNYNTGSTFGHHDITFQLRCDGNGDGKFEYIVNFPESPESGEEMEPTLVIGEPLDMTNGTIELVISYEYFSPELNSESSLVLICNPVQSFIQVPFDLDTDSDGIGDYSDPDDDNDNYLDIDDIFLRNSNEWEDSDLDGIGDNSDNDDNGNGIPDIFELPMAVFILLIPAILIWVFIKRKKKSDVKETESKK